PAPGAPCPATGPALPGPARFSSTPAPSPHGWPVGRGSLISGEVEHRACYRGYTPTACGYSSSLLRIPLKAFDRPIRASFPGVVRRVLREADTYIFANEYGLCKRFLAV